MFDLIGEVLDCARWELLLRGILRRGVRLSDVWQDHLDVGLGAESARLQQRLLVVNAASIHVLPRKDIVKGVCNAVDPVEEPITKDVCVGTKQGGGGRAVGGRR